jgi:adenylate cyclase
MRPRSLLVRYAAGLAFAYVLSAAEVVAIVISVSRETVIEAQSVLSGQNLIATVAIVIVGTATVWASGVALVARHSTGQVTPEKQSHRNSGRRRTSPGDSPRSC